ncbi:hypothetical protein ACROYT_G017406 [Oculina patagonica]
MVVLSTASRPLIVKQERTQPNHRVPDKALEDDFWCPTCQNTSQESCDARLADTTCPKATFCMALWDKTIFTRKCINRKMHELLTKDCRNVGHMKRECKRRTRRYHLSWCNQPGCKAEVTEMSKGKSVVDKPARDDFWCPTCQSTSQESCQTSLSNTTCPKADHCMALSDKNVFARKCVNRKMLELLTRNCTNVGSNEWECNRKRKYHVASCDYSGCQAEFSEITKDDLVIDKPARNDFWCPTCQSTAQKSCQTSLSNTTCPKAHHCMALWDKNVFARKCVNRKMLELLTKNCKNVGSKEWRCYRKRQYRVTACDQSGCKAEFSETTKDDPVINKPVRNDFWCPTCQRTSQESCETTLTNTTCPKADHCMALWDKNVFARKCVNRKMLELLTKDCTNMGSSEWECNRKLKYHVAACDQAGCKAKFSKITKEQPVEYKPVRNDFWCPTCQSKSEESCESTMANTTCPKADHCMALWDQNVFARKCVNRKMLELLTKDCKNVASKEWDCNRKRKYRVVSCDQSGCKAEYSKITKDQPVVYKPVRNFFWCPTCQSTSSESCQKILTNTTCPKADHCMALWDNNVFARKCVNRKMLHLLTKDCTNMGSNEWECNGKRQYHVTACDQSGCLAKIPSNIIPKENPFQCPTCPICKSPKECDHKMTMTKCPTATRCMVLHFNSTVDTQGIFTRKCINEKMFVMIQRACTHKQGCEVTSCTQSGCKATL